MSDTASLLWGLLFGSIGLGYFIYGKKQNVSVSLLCGIGLMVFPYFIANPYGLVITGLILMAAPFFITL